MFARDCFGMFRPVWDYIAMGGLFAPVVAGPVEPYLPMFHVEQAESALLRL